MPASSSHDTIRAVAFVDGALRLLDQRRLPAEETYLLCTDADSVAAAIRDLVVRGAPAIGIAAAWGVVLEARRLAAQGSSLTLDALEPAMQRLNASRPTAVNLAWALQRMRRAGAQVPRSPGMDESGSRAGAQVPRSPGMDESGSRAGAQVPRSPALDGSASGEVERRNALVQALTSEAQRIQDDDLAANRHMGELGAALIAPGSGVLTHCNTGSLATAGFGTALGVIRAGYSGGRIAQVYAGETRPWQQGARLTMWELTRDAIPAKLIADSAAAHLMKSGAVQWVVVGADRIAANGDTANKIGTYQLAISARHHGVKFMVVAPASTVDMQTADGSHIEIELRDPTELFGIGGARNVIAGADAWNPVFDVTPSELIDALVTERGVIERPDADKMRALFGAGR